MKMWRKLECIILSERIQSGKSLYYKIPIILHSRKSITMETVKGVDFFFFGRGWGRREINGWKTRV